MLHDNPLLAQLKAQFNPNQTAQEILIEGVVRAHPKGFGFVDIDPKTNHYIAQAQMKKLLDGDRVKGKLVKKGDQFVFMPSELVASKLDRFLGQFIHDAENDIDWIQPENPLLPKIELEKSSLNLKNESWIVANLTQHPFKNAALKAKVESLIAEKEAENLMWYKALARQTRSPESIEINIDSFVDENALDRKDLTALPFFTIDSESTQDMDDAIFIQKEADDHFLLSVAIADPSAYFDDRSEIDAIAKTQLFTSYLPNLTIDMLPPLLATQLCSLRPNENKAALLIQMAITPNGELISDSVLFDLVTIRSQAKLSYAQVSNWLEGAGSAAENHIPAHLETPLKTLFELMQVRQAFRKKHAFVFENRTDYRFQFDEHSKVIGVEKTLNRCAHLMIEEAMLMANIAVAQRLTEIGLGIFNTHLGIDPKFYGAVADLTKSTDFYGAQQLDEYENYVALRRITDSDPILSHRLRRLHAPAQFSFEPKPHFSLGFNAYATGTSPLRKYSDLINHRLIKADLLDRPLPEIYIDILDDLTEARRKLRQIEREINNALYAEYLQTQFKKPFAAQILDINRGGIRAQLLENGALVFVPISYLAPSKNDVEAQLDQMVIKIKGEIMYRLLDEIEVELVEIKGNSIVAKLV